MIERSRTPEAPKLGIAGAATDQRDQVRDIEVGDPLEILTHCRICSGRHATICPFLRVVEYHPNGQVARMVIEPREALKEAIVYPEDEDSEAELLATLERAMEAVKQAPNVRAARKVADNVLAVIAQQQAGE